MQTTNFICRLFYTLIDLILSTEADNEDHIDRQASNITMNDIQPGTEPDYKDMSVDREKAGESSGVSIHQNIFSRSSSFCTQTMRTQRISNRHEIRQGLSLKSRLLRRLRRVLSPPQEPRGN
jgi:aspartyl aminopeptidase